MNGHGENLRDKIPAENIILEKPLYTKIYTVFLD